MYILHSVRKAEFEKSAKYYGEDSIQDFGFIHCSDLDTYYLVSPNFKDENEDRLLLVIDTEKVIPEIKWEENSGIAFPHIYGLLNIDAIVEILPHLWNKEKIWIPNEELKKYLSKINIDTFFRKVDL